MVAGPDGSGKTAVADALADAFQGPVMRLHHRPQVLPAKTVHAGPVLEPHKEAPYPASASALKVLYLYVDYLLGWWLHIRPWVRGGGAVIFEGGWWDLVVDPVRYRMMPSRATMLLLRTLGRRLPRPAVTVVLKGEPQVLAARKQELSNAELARQMRAWTEQPTRSLRPLFIDVAPPLETVVARVLEDERWRDQASEPRVELARRGEIRWNLPAVPRNLALKGTELHQPMKPSGLTLWHAARILAAVGGFRLLPGAAPPPAEVTRLVTRHVGADSVLAVAKSNHPGRFAVLALSPEGHPRALVKVAMDEVGRDRLAREAHRQRYTEHLPASLNAPRLLRTATGALVFEPIAWRPRRQPWRLPVTVAHGLGAFYRSGANGSGGLSHGDFTPWNLLRTDGGWYLIDWEDAADGVPAFTDVFHYLVQGHALLGQPDADVLLAGLDGRHWTGEVLAAYSQGARVALSDVRPLFVDYLERSSAKFDDRRPDDLICLRTRAALLERM